MLFQHGKLRFVYGNAIRRHNENYDNNVDENSVSTTASALSSLAVSSIKKNSIAIASIKHSLEMKQEYYNSPNAIASKKQLQELNNVVDSNSSEGGSSSRSRSRKSIEEIAEECNTAVRLVRSYSGGGSGSFFFGY